MLRAKKGKGQAVIMATIRNAGEFFWCTHCARTKPIEPFGTGYARGPSDEKICYQCCADIDRARMVREGKADLYLREEGAGRYTVANWPGTLSFVVTRLRRGKHNSAGVVIHAYFKGPDAHEWQARVVGRNTQVAKCKRLKGRV